jgi:ribosomal protein S3
MTIHVINDLNTFIEHASLCRIVIYRRYSESEVRARAGKIGIILRNALDIDKFTKWLVEASRKQIIIAVEYVMDEDLFFK